MEIDLKFKNSIHEYLILSTVSICLIFIIIYFGSSNSKINFADRLIFGVVFITTCTVGISFGKYPGWLKKKILKNWKANSTQKKIFEKIIYKGHHPNCMNFNDHRIEFNDQEYCTGCLGLIIGSIVSIILMIFFLIFAPKLPLNSYYISTLIGFVVIIACFIEIISLNRKKIVHIILNVLLIMSFFLVSISVLEITNNLLFSLVTIIFCFLWLDTRIQLSTWKHGQICLKCEKKCKMYCY